jgi:stage V sporulation protein B
VAEPSQSPRREDTARTAGRGGLAVAAAKIYFILLGFAQQTLLPRVLGAEGYGAFSRVLAIANVADNVVITSSVQGTSRTVAEASDEEVAGAQRGALKIHAALAFPVAALFFVFAPLIGARTGSTHVMSHLRLASLIVLGYALYTPFVGALNGRRRFGRQAALDTTYATLRTIAMLGGGYLLLKRGGDAPFGAVMGFALAALVIVPIASLVSGWGKAGPGAPPLGPYLRFLAPLALGQLFLNALMQSDITLLGLFASQAADAAGLAGKAASDAADRSVAIYRACQVFAFLPYQLLISVTFVLFPLLAKAHGEGDTEAVKTYVRTGLRLTLVLAGAMVAVVAGLSSRLLSLAFPAEIASHGGEALRLLALGQGAFAVYGILTTILSSLHHERWTMVLNAISTGLVVLFAYLLVPGAQMGAAIAERTALATTIALLLALAAGCVAVLRTTGALVSALSAGRVALAFLAAVAVTRLFPPGSKLLTFVWAAVTGVVYLVVLVVTREIGAADVALVKRVLGRKS